MLSTRERFFVIAFAVVFITAADLYLAHDSLASTRQLGPLSERMAFSHNFFYRAPDSTGALFDHDPDTLWSEDFLPPADGSAIAAGQQASVALPPVQRSYIQTELGLTHLPGSPPQLNLPQRLIIELPRSRDYARPQRITLILMQQPMVDADREFRLPPLPSLIKRIDFTVPSQGRQIALPLLMADNYPASPGYPIGIFRLWLRLEINSITPGVKHPNTVAISELDYTTPRPDRPNTIEDRNLNDR